MKKERWVIHTYTLLALIVVLFAGTMILGAELSREELNRQAVEQYKKDASYLKTVSAANILSSLWMSGTFMSDIVEVDYFQDDSVSANYTHYLREDKLSEVRVDALQEKLESFLDYNYQYSCGCLVFEPSVLKDAPDGIAVCRYFKDSVGFNLCDRYDVRSSEIYRKAASSVYPTVQTGRILPEDDPQLIFCVPVFVRGGDLVGQIWIAYDIKDFFRYAEIRQGEGYDYGFAVTDNEGRLIYFSGRDVYGLEIEKSVAKFYKNFPADFGAKVTEAVRFRRDTLFKTEYSRKGLMTYVFPIDFTDFSFIKTYKESTILRKSNLTIRNVALLSIVGFILVLSLLVYFFRKYYSQAKEKSRLENELDVAEHIQRSILPENGKIPLPPSVEVYGFQRSARTIGGDLFDYTVRDGKLYFCIGDVSGNGVPAALMMTQICSLLRHISASESAPASIVSILNDSASEGEEDRMFCTLFAGVLDPSNGSLRFCNAGHCRPVILREGKTEMLTMKANMPVYAFEGYPYVEETAKLEPGDTLFLYTDGVTEARNSSRELFGTERLLLSLVGKTPAGNVEAVLKAIDTFCAGSEQHDDITMLSISLKKYEN